MDWQFKTWPVLDQPLFKLGGTEVRLGGVILAIVFVAGLWWLTNLIERHVLRVAKRHAAEPNTYSRVHVLSRLLRYLIWGIGSLVGLNQIGIDLSSVALIGGALSVPHVLNTQGREPTVWLLSYGDSSMDYELVVWADRELTTHPGSTQAKLMWALDDELKRRDIEIPFPQRDLNIRSGRLDVNLMRERPAP